MDIELSKEDVDSFDFDFTRINHYGGLIVYSGKNEIETTFIDKDNSNEGEGSEAFEGGDLGGIFLLQDWDTNLTNSGYDSDAVTDQKYNDMYIRFIPDVDHANWAKFVDYSDVENDFAIKANRKLLNKLVQRDENNLDYKHAYSFKKKPDDDNYALIAADALSLSIEDKVPPYFRYGAPITRNSTGTPDASAGDRAAKLKESEIIISCIVKTEFRNFISNNDFIDMETDPVLNLFGEDIEENTIVYNMEQSGGFLPFTISEKSRYKWKHIRGGMKDGVYIDEGSTPDKDIYTEDVESDEEKMNDYVRDQYDRMKRQEAVGEVVFIGTNTGYKIGERVDNLVINDTKIPVNVIILDLSVSIDTGTTILSLGKS